MHSPRRHEGRPPLAMSKHTSNMRKCAASHRHQAPAQERGRRIRPFPPRGSAYWSRRHHCEQRPRRRLPTRGARPLGPGTHRHSRRPCPRPAPDRSRQPHRVSGRCPSALRQRQYSTQANGHTRYHGICRLDSAESRRTRSGWCVQARQGSASESTSPIPPSPGRPPWLSVCRRFHMRPIHSSRPQSGKHRPSRPSASRRSEVGRESYRRQAGRQSLPSNTADSLSSRCRN